MIAQSAAPIVDADTHVFESDATWSYLAETERRFRPLTLSASEVPEHLRDLLRSGLRYWFMGGTLHLRPNAADDGFAGSGTLDLRDASARLADMQKMGVDVQVIYSTMFLLLMLPDPEWQMALARSYNRWVADVCSADRKRLQWVAVIEPRLAEASVLELHWAKRNGACGVLMRALEGDTALDHPSYEPIYRAAAELDLAICVHAGNGSPSLSKISFGQGRRPNAVAGSSMSAIAAACWLVSGLPEKYPKLRIGFLETASVWVPFALNRCQRFAERQLNRVLPDSAMRDARVFVACEEYEPLAETLRCLGEDNIIVGTDYGHHSDTSAEMLAHNLIQHRQDLDPGVARKIVSANAMRFYGL